MSEHDAHGRHHRSVEIGLHVSRGADEPLIRMSDGAMLPPDKVPEYIENYDTGEDERGFDTIDALVATGAAALSVAAIAAVVRQLRKKR